MYNFLLLPLTDEASACSDFISIFRMVRLHVYVLLICNEVQVMGVLSFSILLEWINHVCSVTIYSYVQ